MTKSVTKRKTGKPPKYARAIPVRYRKRGQPGDLTWTLVTSIGSDPVGLSGPGPCRGYRSVPAAEFAKEWEIVP